MAHIDANQHGLQVLYLFRQLEVVQVAAHLAIDLLEDVRGLREVESPLLLAARSHNDTLGAYNLRGDLVQLVQLLVLIIEVLISEDHDKHLREAI